MPGTGRRVATCAAIAVVAVSLGCSAGGVQSAKHSRTAVITVDKSATLADEPVHFRITGLLSGEEVTVTSRATDERGVHWSGRAVVTADAKGVVALDRARPRTGTYRGADGMGLFWSMTPDTGDPDTNSIALTDPQHTPSYKVRVAVVTGGRTIAQRTLTRTFQAEGVRYKELTSAKDGLSGKLFLPPAGAPHRAPVLLLGGSEGGVTPINQFKAALLASRGHPALALCYFGCPGQPEYLADVSLEYIASAARFLRAQPQADPRRLMVTGASRGSEAAQLMAQYYPDLVRDAVVYAPSRNTNGTYPPNCCETQAAWTKDGKSLNLVPIPLSHVRGMVLAVAGGDDSLWGSLSSAQSIAQQPNAAGRKTKALLFPKAGHGIGSFPYLPIAANGGGTRAANERSMESSWPQLLQLLQR
ncbi:acyl-CoA thioesterase/BAAT N-terminal domain-containing protein [Streptomyces sp. NPDC001076]